MDDVAAFRAKQKKRLSVFHVGAPDIEVLQRHERETAEKLPMVLASTADQFAEWPELAGAFANAELQSARTVHWGHVLSGHFSAELAASAVNLATIFHRNGLPAYGVAVCHAVVSRGMMKALQAPATGRWFRRDRDKQRGALIDAVNKVALCDLEVLLETYARVERDSRAATAATIAAFQAKTQTVAQAVGSGSALVETSAQMVSRAVEQTGERVTAVTGASGEASANVVSVAAAAEELSASIQEVALQASRAAEIARSANQAVLETDQTMRTLSESARSIGDVVSLIGNIAAQTNLLALNATIEAARAGEAGRGFAVVATEVKSLAGQTAQATGNITTQIKSMQDATEGAMQAIQGIGRIVSNMDRVAGAIAAAVDEQRASTQEIAMKVQQAAQGTREVASNIAGVDEAARESGGAADNVLQVARSLAEQALLLETAIDELVTHGLAA